MNLEMLQKKILQTYRDSEAHIPESKNLIHSTEQLSAEQRFDIYFGSVTEGKASALRETYPICEKIVGEGFFTGMAYEFVEKTPSRSPNLFEYGATFPEFVASFEPAEQLPYLTDVCRLEWARHCAYYGADDQAFDFEVLQGLSEEEQTKILFRLPASATLLQSQYPVNRIWDFCQKNAVGEVPLDIDDGAVSLMVWRKGVSVIMEVLDEPEWFFLKAIESGQRLADLSLYALQHQIDLEKIIAHFVGSGWIVGFEL